MTLILICFLFSKFVKTWCMISIQCRCLAYSYLGCTYDFVENSFFYCRFVKNPAQPDRHKLSPTEHYSSSGPSSSGALVV